MEALEKMNEMRCEGDGMGTTAPYDNLPLRFIVVIRFTRFFSAVHLVRAELLALLNICQPSKVTGSQTEALQQTNAFMEAVT